MFINVIFRVKQKNRKKKNRKKKNRKKKKEKQKKDTDLIVCCMAFDNTIVVLYCTLLYCTALYVC